jgi:GNAT superfamily N-acetyltransferase
MTQEQFELIELDKKEEMLETLPVLNFLYPELTVESYSEMLNDMVPLGIYKQLVVKQNDAFVGVCGFWICTKVWSGKYLELDNFVVHKDFRSKGVGDLIVNYLREKAVAEDCLMLALDSYTDNFPAHKFFMNNGFAPRGFHFIQKLK